MHLAAIHYHLNRGGVRQVILNHLQALSAALQGGGEGPWRVLLVHGGRREGWDGAARGSFEHLENLTVSLSEVAGLDYDSGGPPRPEELARGLERALEEHRLPPPETILHVHNPSLGKNVSLPGALEILARRGYAQLLEIHDFAEDFRPREYARLAAALGRGEDGAVAGTLYPQAAHVHYAVLNGRDRTALEAAGVPAARLHLLPNPVTGPGPLPPPGPAREELVRRCGVPRSGRFVLYPVRAIRRKNLGEALLWSALVEETTFGSTLAPLNPREQPVYRNWQALAAELALPWAFEVGSDRGLSLAENLAAADGVLTTSLAEGFGLVFLETPLAGLPLAGRDLPEITDDFKARGLRLDGLSPVVAVPVAAPGRERLRSAFTGAYSRLLAEYGLPPPPASSLARRLEPLLGGDTADFGLLAPDLQAGVVRQVRSSAALRERLKELNSAPWAVLRGERAGPLEWNLGVVREHYSLERCGGTLLEAYRAVARSPRDGAVEPLAAPRVLLDRFLDPERFRPARVEGFPP